MGAAGSRPSIQHPSVPPPPQQRAHHIPAPCLALGSQRSPWSLSFPALEVGGHPVPRDPAWEEENRQATPGCRMDASDVLA